MLTCRQCGAAAENDQARFCIACGSPLAAAPVDQPDEQTPAVAAVAGARPLSDQAGLRGEYICDVRAKLADGVLDASDRADLKLTQAKAGISDREALALESQAKDELVGSPALTQAAAAPAPVWVEINDSHFYMEEFLGVLDFRFSNHTDQRIEDVHFSAVGKRLGRIDEWRFAIKPRGQTRHMIQIQPILAGEHLIEITLRFRVDRQPHAWSAQCLLRVLAKNEPLENLTLNVDQSTTMTGDRIGFGQSIRKEVNESITRGLIRDVNDLIKQRYPQSWRPVPLRRRETGLGQPAAVVSELADRRPSLDKAALIFPEDAGQRRVLLLGLAQVRMGRKRDANDIVLRRLPRSEKNDRATLQIAGKQSHLVVALGPEGLCVIDKKTANGTQVDGVRIEGQAELPLDRASEVNVAQALRLRFTPYLDPQGGEVPAPEHHAQLGPPDGLWSIAERLGLRSLLIERADNLAREERYLIVYRWAACGRDADDELRLPDVAAANQHFRIVRLGGQFWIASTVGSRRLVVDDIPVGPGSAFPLTPGLTLRYGRGEISVAEFRQIGL